MNKLNLNATRDPQIEGERIYLRRLRPTDVSENYLRWMNSAEIMRYLESRFRSYTMEDLTDFVRAMQDDPYNLFTGIFLKGSDRHIGNIKVGPINPYHRYAEMGLILGETDCWGKGYATEAIQILTDYAFEHVGLHRITAGAYADNGGSTKAFERAGYQIEGVFRNHWCVDGKYQDGVSLGRINPKQRS